MLFSIIIPMYNAGQYLRFCLDSVLAQQFKDYEVIVVDDGSTDDSVDVARSYADKISNFRLICGVNKGPFMARREGLREAQADYVVFLDADDALSPVALKKIANTINSTNADIVSFGFSSSFDFGKVSKRQVLPSGFYVGPAYEGPKRLVLEGKLNSLCGKAIRLCRIDVAPVYGAASRLLLAEDLLQLLPIVDQASSWAQLDDALYYYRPNVASATGTYKHVYLDDTAIVISELLQYGEKWHMENAGINGSLSLYVNILRLLFRCGTMDSPAVKKELSLVSQSLWAVLPDVRSAIRAQRFDKRLILNAALHENEIGLRFLIRITDYAVLKKC